MYIDGAFLLLTYFYYDHLAAFTLKFRSCMVAMFKICVLLGDQREISTILVGSFK